ncbi:BLOC-3 complex member HPS1-like [Styela clava]
MKAYVIVRDDTEVQFVWHDDEFLNRLKYLCQNQEDVAQLSKAPNENLHCIKQLLNPIFLAYFLLQTKFNDTCSVISCKKVGCEILFQQRGDLLYLGFYKMCEVGQYKMKKELSVLHEMTKFLFGPCRQYINPENPIDRSRTWAKLTEALHSFCRLHQSEPSFLVGCIDTLHVNEDVKSECLNIVDKRLGILEQNLKNERVTFGVLFVGNKLLTYHPSTKYKHKLSTGDLLRILIVINSNYREIEELASAYEASSANDAFDLPYSDATLEPDDPSGDDGEKTDCGTLTAIEKSPSISSSSLDVPIPTIEITSTDEVFQEPNDESDTIDQLHQNETKLKHSQSDSVLRSRSNTAYENFIPILKNVADGSEDSAETSSHRRTLHSTGSKSFPDSIPIVAGRDILDKVDPRDIQTYPVFLHTASCRLTPFLMHNVKIADQVTFIVLSEMKGGDIASIICKSLNFLRKIKFNYDSAATAGQIQKATVNVNGDQKVLDELLKFNKDLKMKLRPKHSDQHVNKIFKFWEAVLKQLFELKQLSSDDVARLEQDVDGLTSNLRRLFYRLFLLKPNKSKRGWREELATLKIKMQENLKDYYDFLIVKSSKNVGISWVADNYPGLLHFIVIKRSITKSDANGMMDMNEVFTSSHISLNSNSNVDDVPEDINMDVVTLLQRQIWKGVLLAYSMVNGKDGVKEYTAVVGDFFFSSYFWVRLMENQTSSQTVSNTLANVKATWVGKAFISGVESPFRRIRPNTAGPSIFYEFHLVHFSTVPEETVKEHKVKLWKEIRKQLV